MSRRERIPREERSLVDFGGNWSGALVDFGKATASYPDLIGGGQFGRFGEYRAGASFDCRDWHERI